MKKPMISASLTWAITNLVTHTNIQVLQSEWKKTTKKPPQLSENVSHTEQCNYI